METLLKFDSLNPNTYGKISELYGRYLGDLDKAEEFVLKGFSLEENDPDLGQKLGVIRAMKGDKEGAMQIFKKSLILSPNNANLLLNVGITFQSLGQADSSNYYISKAIEIDPSLKP